MVKHFVFSLLAMFCCGSGMAQMHQAFFIEEFERAQYDEGSMPHLRVYDDVIYVPSISGLYCKDLTNLESPVTQYFKDIQVVDAVCSGNSIVAAVKDRAGEKDSLLLMYDVENDKYTNLTSSLPKTFGDRVVCLAQNPKNSNSLVAVSLYGIYSSEDFGSTWTERTEKLADFNAGIYKAHPDVDGLAFLYGEGLAQNGFVIRISDNWNAADTYDLPGGDGNVYDMAFHPANPNIIIYSGWHIGKSGDCGKTWKQTSDDLFCGRVLFDEVAPDNVYAVSGMLSKNEPLSVYSSKDCGETWSLACTVEYAEDEAKAGVADVIKYDNKLIVYTLHYGIQELDLGTTASIETSATGSAVLDAYVDSDAGMLVFESGDAVEQVELFDMSGRLVSSFDAGSKSGRLPLAHIVSGTYVARFHVSDNCVDKKVFIGRMNN